MTVYFRIVSGLHSVGVFGQRNSLEVSHWSLVLNYPLSRLFKLLVARVNVFIRIKSDLIRTNVLERECVQNFLEYKALWWCANANVVWSKGGRVWICNSLEMMTWKVFLLGCSVNQWVSLYAFKIIIDIDIDSGYVWSLIE